ncbi:MAG: hypothetical protein WCS52_01965 [bacterium]
MLNLNGAELESFKESLKMMVHTEHGRVFLAALEKDLKTLDAKNRVIGQENQVGAAFYLARLFENASNAGYQPAYPYVATSTPAPIKEVPKSRLARVLSALVDTER